MYSCLSVVLGELKYHRLNPHLQLKEFYYKYSVGLSFFISCFVIAHPFLSVS